MASVSKVVLRDGRILAWRAYGRPLSEGGFPVIFTHGNLNSRAFAPAWGKSAALAEEAGACVLAVDRPGYGASSFHRGRTYMDWARDTEQLADHLGLERYACLGFSSGGPHALVSAVANRDRCAACGLVSSDAPYAQMPAGTVEAMFGTAHVDFQLAVARATENAKAFRERYSAMSNAEKRALALEDIETATAQGVDGAASDSVLEASTSWGFALEEVGVPVHLWHGTADTDVPHAAGVFLAEALAKGKAPLETHFIEGENHTLIRRHWLHILQTVVGAVESSQGKA